MLGYIDYKSLEELSKGKGLNLLQNIFNTIVSELVNYLNLEPLYQDIKVEMSDIEKFTLIGNVSILDFGVEKAVENNELIIFINVNNRKFLPFIILREAYYCFIFEEASELVKICVNQIVENNLSKLPTSKEWKKFLRSSLVNRDFIDSQFDKLQKFFNIEAKEPLESSVQFFFKEMRENSSLTQNANIDSFYDIIFERYAYKTSRSLFDSDIIETLKTMIWLFHKNKSYLNMSDYQILFKNSKENKEIDSYQSIRKFSENMQWINNCSSIAPSYDINYSSLGICAIFSIIRFNPLLEKNKIKKVLGDWPFYHSIKFSINSFATEIFLHFIIPRIYLNDFLNYFDSLENSRYIIKKNFYLELDKTSSINLNYFIDKSNIKKIIDPINIKYQKNYEIESNLKYSSISHPFPLSIFDFIILERVRYLSVTGLTFDKRIETLNAIKEDVQNELRKQNIINKEFRDCLDKILNSPKLKLQFLQFLEKNKNNGFLYSYSQLNQILNLIDLISNILDEHHDISNIYQLQKFLNTNAVFQSIEEYLLFRNDNIKKIIFHDYLSLYFQSKESFREEVDKVQSFYNVLDVCYNLKILDLIKIRKMVKDYKIVEEIHRSRERRYGDMFKSINLYKITNEKIESTIEALLNHDHPVLKPILINTILTSTFAKYYPEFILEDKPKVYEALKKLKLYFPRMFIYKTTELVSNRNFICIDTYFINIKEKGLFISILYSYFKDSIIFLKRFFWRGVLRPAKLEPRDLYDFENKCFFYSEDLFKQLTTYSEKILGGRLEWPEYPLNLKNQEFFWSTRLNMDSLVKTVKDRISHQEIAFNLKDIEDILAFRKKIEANLMDHAKYVSIKAERFFGRYINSIKFLPAFRKFGFSQYYLYFRPFNNKSPRFEIDFRLLFINSFQKIKYPASIELNQAIFSSYVFPFRTPNKSYLNWLVKSKKNVSEYCLFHKKKFYDIIHFNRNLTKDGWNYSSIRFKSYMQDILFKPTYEPELSRIREFDLSEISETDIYGPDTQEYEDLIQIYNIHSIDLKSILGTRQYSKISNITELLKKKLIFPYISLKNLDFQDKISFILPDTKQEFNEKIIKIFSFFNVCRIYEIEGEFFIYGFQQERTFENGLLIEIWFPKCELDEFFNVFDLLFHYLEIKHYVILTDLVNGKTLLKSVYGNLDFLKEYNPLLNLIWNDNDKIWMNHKLFNEKFEPIYPDLIKEDK